MWPQIVFLCLSVAGVTLTLTKDETRFDRLATVISCGITHSLLYAGGFYNVFLR